MTRMLITLSLLAACGSEPHLERTPELDELAIATVWHHAFDRLDAPPSVEFVEVPECYADDWAGLKIYHSLTAWSCARGYTLVKPESVRVFYEGTYSKSPIVHELLHVLVMRTTGSVDPGHQDPRFWDGTEVRGRELLMNEGL